MTSLADSGSGSLRQAIIDTPASGTVDFQPGLSGTITLTTGQLTLDKDLNIAGPGAEVITVSGNNASRVFEVTSGTTVALSGLTIANGRVVGASFGGGILNQGILTVTASTLSGNSATVGPSGNGLGGGIFNGVGGTVTVTASTLGGNSATIGGGIFNGVGGTVAVTASTLGGNSAIVGGGISNGGTLTVTASTLGGNSATIGGGIFNGVGGTVAVTASTLSGNYGIAGGGDFPAAPGGGIFSGGTVAVTASTLSGNSAIVGGGIYISNPFGSATTLRNTIIAENTATLDSPDVDGSLASQGHNLIGIGDGGSGYHPTDLVGTAAFPIDPMLEPLGDYGGPTQTMPPRPGSPVIDAGQDGNFPTEDQRGLPRIAGAHTDIGAVELQPGETSPAASPAGLPPDAGGADLVFALLGDSSDGHSLSGRRWHLRGQGST